ncbi:MAG: hypothetical protein R2827_01105 [Bdellovibrionales bacterium]
MITKLMLFVLLTFFISMSAGANNDFQAAMAADMTTSLVGQAGDARQGAIIGSAINLGVGGYIAKRNCNKGGDPMACMKAISMINNGIQQAGSAKDAGRVQNELSGLPYNFNLGNQNTWPDGWQPPPNGMGDWPNNCTGTFEQCYGGGHNQPLAGLCDSSPAICSALRPNTPGDVDLNSLQPHQLEALGNNLLNDYNQQGIRLSPDGSSVTFPGKGTFPTSAISDPKTLIDAGFDKNKVRNLFSGIYGLSKGLRDGLQSSNGIDEAASAPTVSTMGFNSGGGRSADRNIASSIEPLKLDKRDPIADLMRKRQNKKAPTAAGMVRKLATGETIGAKGDNIFEMIHRRYREKARQNVFLEP